MDIKILSIYPETTTDGAYRLVEVIISRDCEDRRRISAKFIVFVGGDIESIEEIKKEAIHQAHTFAKEIAEGHHA